VDPTIISGLLPASEADEPPAPPRLYLDSAEPLTAWRVDLAVLVGVAERTAQLAR
jgi:hypothetical protein